MAPSAIGTDLRPIVEEVARLGCGLDEVWPEVDQRLRPVLGYDSSTFCTVDPHTLLWTSRRHIGLDSGPERERAALELELRGDDLNSFPSLLVQQMPLGSLHTASGADLSRTIRYEPLLLRLDLADEMRAIARFDGVVWAIVTIYRKRPAEPFVYKELRAVRDMLEPLAQLLRLRMLSSAADDPGNLGKPPGRLKVSAEGETEDTSPAAAARLEAADDQGAVPGAVREVVAAAATDALASTWLPSGEEGAVLLHAEPGPDGLSVLVEEEQPIGLHPRIVDAYGFEEMEQKVLANFAQGRTTKSIAQILRLGPFDAQDHIKALLDKTGASTRAALLSTIFEDHFRRPFEAGARPSPYGWFLEDAAGD